MSAGLLANTPDVATFAANVVVFLGAIGAAAAGAFHAVKKVKESWQDLVKPDKAPPEDSVTTTRMMGTLLMETTTATMMTEAQRDLAETTRDLSRDMRDQKDEMKELRYAIQRLTDRMS